MTPDEPEMSVARTAAMRKILADRVRDEPVFRRRRVRHRIIAWGSVGVITIGALTTGAAILLGSAPVTDKTIVHCLSSTTANPDGTYPGSSATIADGDGPGRVDDARNLCIQMWEQGVLSPSVDPTAPTQSPGTAPPLQVCVMRDGTAAVVPSENESVCQSLRMASLEG
ncbi:hypothetical protein DEA06_14315 [Microbacterium sp. Gd 4-13]|uniref:hypothetical protein n=1 Tax=Microbacterium sp. Gd 4-13 TaxID=2173179 RepID=UPI000D566B8E|nr:hypothetical protein [Microbacterium sp. Gd 4-13]PVW02947.1 hypothetical protein DEA06_14315 [Microbacterium sp. Gd 4-13]